MSMGDAAEDHEAANDWSPRAPMIAAMTTAVAMRIVDRVRLLLVLVRCRPCLQSSKRGVASAYVIFDMPTICASSHPGLQ
jgi:hypothetical protein